MLKWGDTGGNSDIIPSLKEVQQVNKGQVESARERGTSYAVTNAASGLLASWLRHVVTHDVSSWELNDNPQCNRYDSYSHTVSATALFLCDWLPILVYTASILISEFLVSVTPPDFRSLPNPGCTGQGFVSSVPSKIIRKCVRLIPPERYQTQRTCMQIILEEAGVGMCQFIQGTKQSNQFNDVQSKTTMLVEKFCTTVSKPILVFVE